ncbi:hypothetical protein, partial [Bradyrhizobium sp.]|uniref:hypothetical protein n=1 Tax=Bradyrhizobium sp. TaxID=376 RepID=UPI0025C51C74
MHTTAAEAVAAEPASIVTPNAPRRSFLTMVISMVSCCELDDHKRTPNADESSEGPLMDEIIQR